MYNWGPDSEARHYSNSIKSAPAAIESREATDRACVSSPSLFTSTSSSSTSIRMCCSPWWRTWNLCS
jgi:hypothetical protein